MRFTPSFLDEIRDRIPIADVVGRRVSFDNKKSNPSKGDYWACCPFHGEKTPSFHCENQKGRYHCFGCGVSGDHFRFLTELDGLSFPEAVERLADEAGIALPAPDPQAAAKEKVRASLFDVMELAAGYFRAQLHEAGGAPARAYLRDRGLSGDVQETFGLGYAPASRSALKEFLGSKGVEKAQIEACGLVVFGADIPVSYDRFRDRIMFPIHDPRGRVIAFGGRALSPDVPAKYLNSPETELFSKSNVLYNYGRARKAVARGGNLIVAEGYMDVIALHAAGFENAVAPLGTALTERQLDLAWKVGPEPVLCFDGDEAGIRAAGRSLDLILPRMTSERSARFIELPEGLDPDDFIKERGAAALKTVIDNAMPASHFILHRRLRGAVFDTPEHKLALEKTVIGDIDRVDDKAMAHHLRQFMRPQLAALFYQRDVQAPVATVLGDAKRGVVLPNGATLRETLTLGLCIEYPILLSTYIEELMMVDFSTKKYARFQRELQIILGDLADYTVSEIYKKISPDFYDVLEDIHGLPREPDAEGTVRFSLARGHRLKTLLPALRYDPPFALVEEFLVLLFRQFEEKRMEIELSVSSAVDDMERYLLQLEDLRNHQTETSRRETELDEKMRDHAKYYRASEAAIGAAA